jgi:hypothetical protein
MESILSVPVSTIANSVTRVQASSVRSRTQHPAATHAEQERTPLTPAEASARQLLTTCWGWS